MITLSNMLKAFVGMIVAASGLVFITTPPAAASTDVKSDTVLCSAEASDGDTTYILMDQDFYQMDKTWCSKLSAKFKETGPGYSNEEFDYKFVSWCANSRNIELVDKACELGIPAITIQDWNLAPDLSSGVYDCLYTEWGTEYTGVGRPCAIYESQLSESYEVA